MCCVTVMKIGAMKSHALNTRKLRSIFAFIPER